jgi:hypothetical protein
VRHPAISCWYLPACARSTTLTCSEICTPPNRMRVTRTTLQQHQRERLRVLHLKILSLSFCSQLHKSRIEKALKKFFFSKKRYLYSSWLSGVYKRDRQILSAKHGAFPIVKLGEACTAHLRTRNATKNFTKLIFLKILRLKQSYHVCSCICPWRRIIRRPSTVRCYIIDWSSLSLLYFCEHSNRSPLQAWQDLGDWCLHWAKWKGKQQVSPGIHHSSPICVLRRHIKEKIIDGTHKRD